MKAFVNRLGTFFGEGGAQGDEDRVKVLWGGNGRRGVRGSLAVFEKGLILAGFDAAGDPLVESNGPALRWKVLISQVHAAQIVDDTAAADNQDAFPA